MLASKLYSPTLREIPAEAEIASHQYMLKAGLIPSKGEGRRLVQQGGVSVDDKKVTDIGLSFTSDDLKANAIIVKKGKKIFHKVQA